MNEQGLTNGTITQRMAERFRNNHLFVFAALWLILLVLYIPAVKAGWVSDVDELVYRIHNGSFWDYLNAKLSRGNLYQVSWTAFYLLYRLSLVSQFLCYALIAAMQAVNATLIFSICSKLFTASGTKRSFAVAAGSALLFCIAPHISEVLVWKAAFHYILAMLMLLCVVYNAQQFLLTGKRKHILAALVIFLVSTFSHEFFYLTPFFVLTIILYYRFALGHSKSITRKALLHFFLPLCALILFHQLLLTINSGAFVGTLDSEVRQSPAEYLRKPALYLFNIIFLGRYFTFEQSHKVYALCSSWKGIALFYGISAIVLGIACVRIWKRYPGNKVFILIFCWMAAAMALVSPMWFADTMLITFDRYSYYMLPFVYLLLMWLLVQLPVSIAALTFTIYCCINIYFTTQINMYWHHSAKLKNSLVHNIPVSKDKTILLLNIPEYLNGASIFGPWWHFSFRQAHNLYNERQITDTMYDVVSYNMVAPGDGVHVTVINDSVLHVTLNQWGTWWWDNLTGAYSHENKYYKFNLTDPGHEYELTLKKPASEYFLLFQVGEQWKTVDMIRTGQEQH